MYCTSLVDFSVDITEDIYNVTSSGTYFTENGNVVSGTLNTISGGYSLSYTTVPSGSIALRVYASNDNNEFVERDYELQYGYRVSWEKVNYWGPYKEVPVSVTAENTALASNTAYFSTFFETKKYRSTNLEASITAEGSGYSDIACHIIPQSMYFIYGKTYSVVISGIKDFSGNEISTKTYSFTVEDEIVE